MARDKKIHTHISSGGIGLLEEGGAATVKNMISENGINIKRQGHKNILELTDKDFNRLRINGIFNYSYEKDGVVIEKKIIHARDKLFSLDADFKNPKEIELPSGISLLDTRTQAFSRGNMLWLLGGGDILVYDGESIKSATEHPSVYVPETTLLADGERRESPNLLTRKRINTFVGTTHFRDSGATNAFLLDEKVKYGTSFLLEIKIKTRTSEEAPDSTTSQYIGVDSLGKEVGKIVTLRYEKKNLTDGAHYFLAEPIKDESGNIINLKIDDEILTFDKLPFGVSVRNGREVRVAFDLPAPIRGESNVFVEYISEEEGDESFLNNAKIVATANGERGTEIMLLNFGDNKIYFTDEKRGLFYLPKKNEISLGSDGEKISAIVKLSDNIVGVFKKNSFFRIKFSSSGTDGYEIISSTDLVGAYSNFSTALVDYDCLVLNSEGVYGVSEYKSTSNVFNCLRPRASKIKEHLSRYTSKEKENAQAIAYKSRYYLFIGEDVYIADTRRKYKEKGRETDAYEYEWWIWDGCSARILYSDGANLYFGTENGEICVFYDGYFDIYKKEFSNKSLSLVLNNEGTHTEFIIPKADIDFNLSHAHLDSHKRLFSSGAIFENGLFYLDGADIFFSDGSVKIYEGDLIAIYDKDSTPVLSTTVKETDLIFKSIEPSETNGLVNGKIYDVYMSLENGYDYGISESEMGINLLWNNEKIKIADEETTLAVIKKTPIECVYKTLPLDLETLEKKTLYNLFLKLSNKTRGEVEIFLETEKTILKKKIFIAEPISFDNFSLENLTFQAPFKSSQLVRSYLRNFESLTIEIKSKGIDNFGLEEISLLYLKSPKEKRN